jgi:UDP-N-acetylglucosamine 2-epimerase (non-hydrolysing)
MKKVEPVFITERPDLILVVGDVNSTLACALTASKLGIPVAHVEAGLRSFDRSMPEEINRVLTDAISDYLFVSEDSALINLTREGIPEHKAFFVGNTMIDTLLEHRKKAESISPLNSVHLESKSYGVVTLHRPHNVENRENLNSILDALAVVSRDIPLIFPVHPRTLNSINNFGLQGRLSEIREGVSSGIYMTEPLGYLNFLSLMTGAGLVFTDSGGIQEETTVLGIPCITLRDNTERPVTVTYGTNVLAGADKNKIIACAKERLNGYGKDSGIPELWDGKAAKRIVSVLIDKFSG